MLDFFTFFFSYLLTSLIFFFSLFIVLHFLSFIFLFTKSLLRCAHLLLANLSRFYFQKFNFYFLVILFHIWLVFVDSVLIFYVFIPFFMSSINWNIYFIVFIWLFYYLKVLEVFPIVYCDCWLSFMVYFFRLCWILDYELIFRKALFMELGNGPG